MASPMPLVPPIITSLTFYTFYIGVLLPSSGLPGDFEPFGMITGAKAAVKGLRRFNQNTSDTARGCWGRQVDTRDLDDGLPRGFLAGVIVEAWVVLRLNRA